MVSLATLVECERRVSRVSSVQRVSSVGVTDESSLTSVSVRVCAIVSLLASSVCLFLPGRIVLVFLLVLFHRWYRKAS